MPRAPKIIEETTGRLKRRTKAKFFKTKNLLVVSGGDIFDNEDEDDPLFGPLLPQTQFHFSKKI